MLYSIVESKLAGAPCSSPCGIVCTALAGFGALCGFVGFCGNSLVEERSLGWKIAGGVKFRGESCMAEFGAFRAGSDLRFTRYCNLLDLLGLVWWNLRGF